MAKESLRSFLFFNGLNNYITLPNNSIPTSPKITVSFWSYGGGTLPNNTSIIYAVDVNGDRTLNIHLPWDNSNVDFDCGNSGHQFNRIERQADAELFKERWSHWAFTQNAITGKMKIYHNGEIWLVGEGKTLMLSQAAGVSIGSFINKRFNHQFYYHGSITELKIWNIERDANDIKQDMHKQLSGNEEGLVSYWPLDEQEGSTVYDKTQNCEPGIISGSVNWIELERLPLEVEEQPKSTPPSQEPEELLDGFPQNALYLMLGGVALVAEEASKALESFTDIGKEVAEKIIAKGQEVYHSPDAEQWTRWVEAGQDLLRNLQTAEELPDTPKSIVSPRNLVSPEAAPGAITLTDPEQWTIWSKAGQDIFMSSRSYGSGRIIAVGHESFLVGNLDATADRKAMLKQSFQWLSSLSRNPLILFSTGHCEWVPAKIRQPSEWLFRVLEEWNYQVGEISRIIDNRGLESACMLVVGNAWGNLIPAEVESIKRFVANGGSLLVAGLGWSWKAYAGKEGFRCEGKMEGQDTNDLSTYPMNQVVKPYGMMWTEKIIDV